MVVLFDLNNPEHQKAIENACINAFKQLMDKNLIIYQEIEEEDERWTTDDVCEYFGVEGKPVKRPTIYKYIREWGLPYTPGKPSKFWKSEVLKWEKEVLNKRRSKE